MHWLGSGEVSRTCKERCTFVGHAFDMKIRLLLCTAFLAVTAVLALPTLAMGGVIARGTFHNVGNEKGRGTVTVVSTANGGRVLKLSRNFAAFNGVSLRLWLATSPSASTRKDLGKLNKFGAQSFTVPKSVNLRRYRYVIAWRVKFSVPITQAILR